MIEVVNRQRKRKLSLEQWESLAAKVLELLNEQESTLTIAFVSDHKIRELNRRFRGIDSATDVLSFPTSDPGEGLGDIAVSVERAELQAKENGLSFDAEVAQLILHGVLHLCGYDHETDNGEMNRLELRLRRKLRI